MKKNLIVVCFLLFNISLFGQTQKDIDISACDDYRKADQELNQIYQKILKVYREDTAFIKNIKNAQMQWIKLRDADLKAIYTPGNDYGSVRLMCQCYILEAFTKDRIKFLKTWSEGVEEGDVCTGTQKVK